MTEQVMELVQGLCGAGQDEEILRTLCGNACRVLDGLLLDGVSPQDCAEPYRLAAAWIAMDWLGDSRDWDGVTSLSAGDMTVRRDGSGESGKMSRKAMELMTPYLRDRGFVFRGVRG